MATWGYRRKYGPPARNIPPQVGRVGSTPKPRKLRLASAVIAGARLKLERIKIGASLEGDRDHADINRDARVVRR